MRRFVLVVGLAAILAACGSEPAPVDGGGGEDAASRCSAASECDDGRYCNGPERCAPDDPDADARGCAPGAAPCERGLACDESSDSCRACAGDADADGDGHDAAACGGDDCDDADAERSPSGVEVCDARGHDEDCDPTTYGARDADGDGVDDAACCNVADDGSRACGDDCDDTRAGVRPGATESCDAIDDDCDGAIDEALATAAYAPDCDGDGFGSRLVAPRVLCGPPIDAPCGSGGAWSTMPTDCDDTLSSRSPVATEVCNGGDDDCDGTTDEASSAASCALAFGAAEMACERGTCIVGACVDGRGDCDGIARNGCEIDLATNAMHCGACGALCVIADATAVCRDRACDIGTCNSGFHRCADACVPSVDVATCGSSCTPCAAGPAGSHTTCDGTRCGWECDPGRILIGGACVVGPRPVFPPSGSILTTRQPSFRWELGRDQTGARLEICADRGCTSVLATHDFTGSSGTPSAALPAGLVFYRFRGITSGAVAAEAGVTWEILAPRAGASATTGTAWGSVFDPNGDGAPDVGANALPGNEIGIFDGGGGSVATTPSRRLSRPAGLASTVAFGYQVAAIGDVNGDGYVDVGVATAPNALNPVLPFYVYFGGPGSVPTTPSQTLWSPLGGASGFGLYGFGAGDVDGDGYSDLVIGDPRFAGSSADGWVHLFRGGPSGLATVAAWSVRGPTRDFGTGVAVADFNCDGRADVVASAPTFAGRGIQVYYAGATLLPLGPSQELAPTITTTSAGGVLDAIGDVDANGCPELAASVVDGSGNTLIPVWGGGTAGFYPAGWQTSTLATIAGARTTMLRYAGDLDGDGDDETIAVTSTRVAASFRGFDFSTPTTTTLSYDAYDWASIGDVDRDGFADVAIGGPAAVWVYRGRVSGWAASPSPTLSYPSRDVD